MTAPSSPPSAADAPAQPLAARLRRLLPYFRDSRWSLAAAALAAAVASFAEPLLPAMMKPLLDSGFQRGALPLWAVPVAVVGLFALRGAAGFVAEYALAWSANRGVAHLRAAMFGRLLDAEPALFAAQPASTVINTVVYEVQGGANQLVHSLLSLVKDALTTLALLAYLIFLNWQLTLFVGVLFPTVALAMRALTRRLHRLTVASQQAIDDLAYVVEENVLAWRIVRLHDAGREEARRFIGASEALRRLAQKSVVAAAAMTPLTQVLAAASLSAVLVAALWQSGTGGGSVGSFVAFITAMLMLIAPVKHLSEVAAPITRGVTALERGIRLIDGTPAERGGSFDPGRAKGHLQLDGVTLRYRDDQPAALDGVTLDLAVGTSVALVGPSGSGKSTLVNLLPRFLHPSAGTIRLDGQALAAWDVRALRRQFALVSQDVVLFNDSVAANVSLGQPLDRERVTAALRGANLLDFALALPQGIDTVVGHNGGQLSGGQRQRMAIARAIYKDAPVLLLDEATSALDSESERLVQAALETLMQGRTSVVVAHRLSTIERCDRIVVLEAGRIAEQGTHAELLAAGGLYARLHALQFGG